MIINITKKVYVAQLNSEVRKKYFNILQNSVYLRVFNDGTIKIMNLTPYKIEVEGINLFKRDCIRKSKKEKKDCIDKDDLKLSLPSSDLKFYETNLKKNLDNYESISLNVKYKTQNLKSSKFDIENIQYSKLKNQKTLDINNFKIIDNNLIFDEGITKIEKPLILQKILI